MILFIYSIWYFKPKFIFKLQEISSTATMMFVEKSISFDIARGARIMISREFFNKLIMCYAQCADDDLTGDRPEYSRFLANNGYSWEYFL